MMRTRGTAVRVRAHRLPPETAANWDFDQLYEFEFETHDGKELRILSANCPNSWRRGLQAKQPASVSGLRLGTLDGRPLWVAKRVEWYPQLVDRQLGLNQGQLELAAAGMDIGLFDQLRRSNRKAIEPGDADPLFQLMLATNRLQGNGNRGTDADLENWLPAISDSLNHLGERFYLEGKLTAVSQVAIDSSYYRKKLGIDHYYQLSVMVPLGDNEIRIVNSQQDNDESKKPEELVYRGNYLVTVIAPELPGGDRGRIPAGCADLDRCVPVQAVVFSIIGHARNI